jgi:hypothetical protein
MLQRNTSLDFTGPSRVSGYLLSLHFACICSRAALQRGCDFGGRFGPASKKIFCRKSTFLNILPLARPGSFQ